MGVTLWEGPFGGVSTGRELPMGALLWGEVHYGVSLLGCPYGGSLWVGVLLGGGSLWGVPMEGSYVGNPKEGSQWGQPLWVSVPIGGSLRKGASLCVVSVRGGPYGGSLRGGSSL